MLARIAKTPMFLIISRVPCSIMKEAGNLRDSSAIRRANILLAFATSALARSSCVSITAVDALISLGKLSISSDDAFVRAGDGIKTPSVARMGDIKYISTLLDGDRFIFNSVSSSHALKGGLSGDILPVLRARRGFDFGGEVGGRTFGAGTARKRLR